MNDGCDEEERNYKETTTIEMDDSQDKYDINAFADEDRRSRTTNEPGEEEYSSGRPPRC